MKKAILCLICMFAINSFVFAATEKKEPVSFLSVEVENHVFSPTAHLFEGIIFIPKTDNIKRIKEWSLTIRNDSGEEVAILKGKWDIPKQIVWDVLTPKGKPVKDGEYSYELVVDDGNGVFMANGADIIVISKPPKAAIKLDDDVLFLDDKSHRLVNDVVMHIDIVSDVGIDYARSFLSVINFNGIEVKTFTLKESAKQTIEWNGVEDMYNISLPPGSYKASVTVFDIAGNTAQNVVDFLIVTQAPKVQASSVVPVKPVSSSKDAKKTSASPSAPAPAVVKSTSTVPAVSKTAIATSSATPVNAVSKEPILGSIHRIYFPDTNLELSADDKQLLDNISARAKTNNEKIRVDGYTDNTPKEKAIKNLAANRAYLVRNYLVKQTKFPQDKIKTIWHPVPRKASDKNRCVRIELTK